MNRTIRFLVVVCSLFLLGWVLFRSDDDVLAPPSEPATTNANHGSSDPIQVEAAEAVVRKLVRASEDAASALTLAEAIGKVARVTGTVVDSNQRPVAGVVVHLQTHNQKIRSEPTDHRGEFVTYSLAFGARATVVVDESTVPQGFLVPWRQDTPSIATQDPGFPNGFHAKEVTIPEQGEATSVTLRLFLSGSAWGQVVTAAGEPVGNAHVRLQSRIAGLNGLAMDGKSDAAGLYVIEKLYPGKYRIEVSLAEAGQRFREMSTPIPIRWDVGEGAIQQLPRIVIGQGSCEIFGTVVNQDGRPYPGLEVIAYPKEAPAAGEVPLGWNSSVASAITDSRGQFRLPAVPAYRYGVFVGRNAFDASDPIGELPDGTKKLAAWSKEIEVDTRSTNEVDLGRITATESRPFVFKAAVDLQPGFEGGLSGLRVEIKLLDPQLTSNPLDPKIALCAPAKLRVEEDGSFTWRCNTPHPEVVVTLSHRKTRTKAGPIRIVPTSQPTAKPRMIAFPDG